MGFTIKLSDLAMHTFNAYSEYIGNQIKKKNNQGKEIQEWSLDDIPTGTIM